MHWLDRLERRFGRYSIPNLMNIVLIGQVAVWFITMFVNYGVYSLLLLTRSGLAHLELWRLVSFIFVPSLQTHLFYFALEIYFYWWVGNSLERAWGDFRFMVYWLAGMVGAILSCLIVGAGGTSGLFLSLFFAYAWMWPDQQILLFFFIPVKVKWIGWISGAVWLWDLVTSLLSRSYGNALSQKLLFFGGEIFHWCPRHRRQLQAPPGLAEQVEMIPAGQAFCLCAAGGPAPAACLGLRPPRRSFSRFGACLRALLPPPSFHFSGRFYP